MPFFLDGDRVAGERLFSGCQSKDRGDIIADAMDEVGKDGTITVEEAKGIETTLEVVEGMQLAAIFVCKKRSCGGNIG